MAREKFQTLTEQMFYVLLCLREECCGCFPQWLSAAS